MEESATLPYMLHCDTLYSLQRSKTSEEPGGKDNSSLDFDIFNDLRLLSLE